jgi:hypothetical protein
MSDMPDPEPALPPIMPTGASSPEGSSVPAMTGTYRGKILHGAWTMRYWIVTAGTAAAAIPGTPGIERAVAGRPGALPLLVLAGVVAIITVVLNAVAVMYQARQETRRKEIEFRSIDVLTAAAARCLDAAHAKAQNLPPARELEEAARVRADAHKLLTDVMPHIAAVLDQDSRQTAAHLRAGHQPRGRR